MGSRTIPVFRSADAAAFAQAIALLKAAALPFQAFDRNEGGLRTPRRVHWIAVAPADEAAARRAIAQVPTELILPEHVSTPTPGDRLVAGIQLVTLATIIVVAIIMAIRRG